MACVPFLLGFGPISTANVPAGSFLQFYMCDVVGDLPATCCAGSFAFVIADGSTWRSIAVNTWMLNIVSMSVGAPVARSVSFATAYQASTPSKPAKLSVIIDLTASVSIGTVSNAAQLWIGPTNSVASGAGTDNVMADAVSSALTVTLISITNTAKAKLFIDLPANYYFAVLRSTGTGFTINNAFDQTVG